ncbi:MAG: protein kinase domain-containing protein [Myxococcota bacterium]
MPRESPKIGKYDILTQLSVGGMAELFLAFTTGPGGFRKYVVVKRVLPEERVEEQFVRMFLDEARITAAFNHPNICQVFELGEEKEGLYLAMEFISGQNLSQITAACAAKPAILPVGFSVAVAIDVALALHYAHTFADAVGRARPVIHRDVAHKNVMVTYEGVVKLLDFGIAKARDSLSHTRAGTVKGTTGYMSPEQVQGEELDGRSDVFGLGVVLHELITGRRLFSAETDIDEMKMILHAPIPKPSEVLPALPKALSEVVMRALAREKSERYPTARDFAKALERAGKGLLFDLEQRAVFMRELFEKERAATRALLEKAETQEDSAALSSKPTDAEHRDTQEAQPSTAATPTAVPRRPGLGWLGALSLLAVLVAFGAYRVWTNLSAAEEPPPVPAYQDPSPIPEFGQRSAPPEPSKEEVKEVVEKPRATKVSRAGTLTLVTVPEAKVLKGKKELGQTPLFNASLPAGTHRLYLVGPDGRKRMLSVPISAGKNTAFRVKLEDLPEK